jgi:serine/threonine protein kinase
MVAQERFKSMRAMPTSGEQLGPYHLSIALGFTDRSAVFSANHTGSGREVTVAVMLPDHADDLEAVQQFFREARSLKVLSHENLVEVVDILEEPQPFFAVEAMRGQLTVAPPNSAHGHAGTHQWSCR